MLCVGACSTPGGHACGSGVCHSEWPWGSHFCACQGGQISKSCEYSCYFVLNKHYVTLKAYSHRARKHQGDA